MTEVVREHGVRNVTVAHVVARSGVSRRTFYDLFDDREECLVAAFEHAVEHAAETVLPAYKAAGGWQEQIRAAIEAALGFLDAEPAWAPSASWTRSQRKAGCWSAAGVSWLRWWTPCTRVDALNARTTRTNGGPPAGGPAGRDGSPAMAPAGRGTSRRPPRIVAEGAVGAVLAVVHTRMVAANARPLSGLLGPLTSMIVLPYLGPDGGQARAARRPRAPALPRRSAATRCASSTCASPTARFACCSRSPTWEGGDRASRQVADASGVADPGQMSKLLWRLEHLGLIANAAPTHGRGEPNAWSLTPRGREVERAIRAQAGF